MITFSQNAPTEWVGQSVGSEKNRKKQVIFEFLGSLNRIQTLPKFTRR